MTSYDKCVEDSMAIFTRNSKSREDRFEVSKTSLYDALLRQGDFKFDNKLGIPSSYTFSLDRKTGGIITTTTTTITTTFHNTTHTLTHEGTREFTWVMRRGRRYRVWFYRHRRNYMLGGHWGFNYYFRNGLRYRHKQWVESKFRGCWRYRYYNIHGRRHRRRYFHWFSRGYYQNGHFEAYQNRCA